MDIKEAIEKHSTNGSVMVHTGRRSGRKQFTHRKVTYRKGKAGVTVDGLWREISGIYLVVPDANGNPLSVAFSAPVVYRRSDGSIWGVD